MDDRPDRPRRSSPRSTRKRAASRAAETRRRNWLLLLERIRTRTPYEDHAVGVFPALLVQAALPHKEVYALGPGGTPIVIPTGQRSRNGMPETTRALATQYQTVNGDLTLTVRAGLNRGAISRGIPYGGLARLLLAYVVTEAKRRNSQVVDLGDTLTEFCERVAITPSGGKNGRIPYLTDQLLRLATCAITYEWEKRRGYGAAPTLRGDNLFLATHYRFWHCDATPGSEPASGGSLRLADDFWRDVARSCVPFDLRKVQLLRHHPTAIDLYLWLTHRLHKLDDAAEPGVALSLDQLHAQLGSHYATRPDGRLAPTAKQEFGRAVTKALTVIRAAWPSLHVERPRGRLVLHATGPDIPRD
jgi:hypothetical protein